MKRKLQLMFAALFALSFLNAQKAEFAYDMNNVQQDKSVVSHNTFSESKAVIDYTFSEATGTFTTISSTGTSLGSGDDTGLALDLTGTFTFMYNMVPYSTFCVNTNGAVKLGTTTGFSTLTNDLAAATNYPVFAGVWDDMVVSGGCYYQIDGSVLTIEWNQVYRYGQTGNINFQIKMDNSTGDIIIIYDAMTAAASWTNGSASIGINGWDNSAVAFWSVTPGTPATVSSTTSNNTIAPATLGAIAAGTTYTFTAPEALAHDLAVTAIFPLGASAVGSIVPQVTVFNYGSNDESTWSVNLTDGGSYNETVSNLSTITALNSLVIDFPAWVPEVGTYTLHAQVTLSGDENAGNDILEQDVLIYQVGTPIYEQHEFVNGFGTHSTGADVSELAVDQTTWGHGFAQVSGYSIADDIIVPDGEEWTVKGFNFFGYQSFSTTESTFTGAYVEVWTGNPSSGGTLLTDFSGANLMVTTFWTNAYRISNAALTNTDRPVMQLVCTCPDLVLTPGEYWVELTTTGSLASGPWMPHLQLIDGNTTTGNALQYDGTTWTALTDVGLQGMPFDVLGTVMVEGAAPITFVVDNTANTAFTGFALKGSWDAGGNYDATWMGGAEHTDFYDDGTHGDVTAGDDIWTVTVNLMADGGTNTWEWGVNDQDGTWIDGNFQFTVPDETPQILNYATVGIKNIIGGINIYPNPSNGLFNISVENSTNLEVYDISGKLMKKEVLNGVSSIQIDNAGMYFFKFSNEEGSTTQRVIVK
jgi:hypothetical protein